MPSDIFNRFARSKPTLTFPRIKQQHQPSQNMTRARKAWVTVPALPARAHFAKHWLLLLGEMFSKSEVSIQKSQAALGPVFYQIACLNSQRLSLIAGTMQFLIE